MSSQFMSSKVEEEIKRVPLSVALLSSPSIEMPILVDVRAGRNEHGGRAAEMATVEKKEPKKEVREVSEEKEERRSMLARLLGNEE